MKFSSFHKHKDDMVWGSIPWYVSRLTIMSVFGAIPEDTVVDMLKGSDMRRITMENNRSILHQFQDNVTDSLCPYSRNLEAGLRRESTRLCIAGRGTAHIGWEYRRGNQTR
jgi:hypothetical protein